MKNKNIIRFLLKAFCLLSIIFVSCSSADQKEVYIPVDYSEETAVSYEINKIRTISNTDLYKGLWLSFLLKEKLPENEKAKSLYDELCENCVQYFNESKIEKKYFDCLYTFKNLSATGYPAEKKLSLSESELKKLCFASLPGSSEASVKNASMKEMIKGTVTVFVDKGIKVQHGMGYADAVLGSGFFISKNGYIITNHHVIEDMVNKRYEGYSRLYIKLAEDPETRIPAKVIGYDSTIDLALLKTEVDAPYVFALGSSSDLSVGDKVFAMGSPLGLENTITSGIISSTDRQLFSAGTVFQIDAAVNSGNSGGPLVDSAGRVQAVVFAGVPNYQGLNFAIPVEYLKNELPHLFEGGEREHPWIEAFGRTKKNPGSGTKAEGVIVNYVIPGGNAYLSGIEENDTIICVEGVHVNTLTALHKELMKYRCRTIISVTVKKQSGQEKTVKVYLSKRSENPGYEVYRRDSIENALYPILGMKLVTASSVYKNQYTIEKVLKASGADETGFSENDPIEIKKIEFNADRSVIIIQVYAKKRKKGFMDINLGLSAPLDSPYYF